ncbi:hypothetical protein L2E82_22611 [Cichorium intybus]|uniref:Uncharacterized protein n=1 Tax=Cichorium intybus TaxID=13427 RepID=A0ACB9DXU5_CICIN|nr:hypothetical protein L2E82_22611 [Cichorium intybus]
MARTENWQPPIDIRRVLRIVDDLPAISFDSLSSSSRETDEGVVPVWSPSNSSFTDTFVEGGSLKMLGAIGDDLRSSISNLTYSNGG